MKKKMRQLNKIDTSNCGFAADNSTFCDSRGLKTLVNYFLSKKHPVLLTGPTGCGKTTLTEEIAFDSKQPLHTVVGHPEMSSYDLLGRWHLTKDGSIWRDGPLTVAVREGHLFYLDEFNCISDDAKTVLYPLLDHRCRLIISAYPTEIEAHQNFRFVASMNPGYQNGKNSLPTALRQRFSIVRMDYLAEKDEVELVHQRTGLKNKMAKKLVQMANVIRRESEKSFNQSLGTRVIITAADCLVDGLDFNMVIRNVLITALSDDEKIRQNLVDLLITEGFLDFEPGAFDDCKTKTSHF